MEKTKYKKLFISLIKKYGIELLDEFYNIINNNSLSENGPYNIKLGQKLIPLSLADVQNPFNIEYKPWREYLLNINLSNLVVNNVAPGFSINNNYSYIKDSKKRLYDNTIQYEKLKRSEIAVSVFELLNKARSYTHMNFQENKIIREKLNSWISNKFKTLYEKINDPIDYLKSDLIMSEVTLAMISEYTGRTFWDMFHLVNTSVKYNKLLGMPFTSGTKYFSKYIFDICYNLLAMNKVYGVLHGDLHLNNMTIHNNMYSVFSNKTNKLQVMYVINDKHQYLFETCGYYSCLIDFSRSIILTDKIEMLKDSNLPKSHIYLDNKDKFFKDQIKRLIQIYLNNTDSKHDIHQLELIFYDKFDYIFKLLTASDVYSMVDKLLNLFTLNSFKINKKNIDLLTNIKNISYKFISEEMAKLLNIAGYEKIIEEMEWPIETIIKSCFYENEINNCELFNICDLYNLNNEMNFSIHNTKNLPSYWPITHKNYKLIINNYKKFEKIKSDNLKTINLIASRHHLKYQ